MYDEIVERAEEPRRFIQVLAGPRQVGKTTLARQAMDAIGIPGHFASADAPDPEDVGWIYTQWQIGRQAARNGGRAGGILVLDEAVKRSPFPRDATGEALERVRIELTE